jgi:hypothetical protein
MLKATFCALHKVGEFGELVPTLLLAHTLDLQVSYFKMNKSYERKMISIHLTNYGAKFLDLQSSTKSFHNSLELLKL